MDDFMCSEMLKESVWLVSTFYTMSRFTFKESTHTISYSINVPTNSMFRVCNNLKDFDFNFDCESKRWHLTLDFD